MPQLVHTDAVFRVEPGTSPDYDSGNSLLALLAVVEQGRLAAERECYDPGSLQHVLPLSWLELFGPAAPDQDQLDPAQQDNKNDFQKQNVRSFRLADTQAVRGWAAAGDWRGPFLSLSYRGGPDSALAESGAAVGDVIGCVLSLPGRPETTLRVPYDPDTDRYAVELWARSQGELAGPLGERGQAAVEAGRLLGRPDLVSGGADELARPAVDGRDLRGVSPEHTLHPILPLYLNVRWTAQPDGGGASDGPYRLGFEMLVRGWDNYLAVGSSGNPHGGVGALEYRTLLSNYGAFQGSGQLARDLEPYNVDAFGRKGHAAGDREPFMAVDYLDLHVLDPACGIGLHRHRDNQEIFFMLDGEAIMVIGDWADSGRRTRSFEVRRLAPGHFAMLKGGNLHGLMNPADVPASLFMFGGYD
ncbi:MAG: cupin domain-containing protein [Pseudonocardiaceae bacterium]